jgi:hypothetical protein
LAHGLFLGVWWQGDSGGAAADCGGGGFAFGAVVRGFVGVGGFGGAARSDEQVHGGLWVAA